MIGALVGLLLPGLALWTTMWAWGIRSPVYPRALRLAVAVGGGVGLASLTTIVLATLGLSSGPLFIGVDALLWLAIAAVALSSLRRQGATLRMTLSAPGEPERPLGLANGLARVAFVAIAVLAVAAVVSEYRAAPHGQWDAWAIWNQKARFIARGADGWRDVLAIGWSNPGHPLLLPATVARLWAYAGAESTLVPAGLALVLGGAIVAVVMGGLGLERTSTWVAGSLLLAPAVMVEQVSSQRADVPVAFFVAATMVVLARHAHASPGETATASAPLWLAGLLAGLSAWTKNEGLFFVAVATLLVLWWARRRERWPQLTWWAIGAAPALLVVAWFKLALAPMPPPYLLETQSTETIVGRLIGPESRAILGAFLRSWLTWGGPMAAGVLPVTMTVGLAASIPRRSGASRGVMAAVMLMIGGYLGVYVLTPLDAAQLLEDTFDRLLTQLWPAIVFAMFATGSPLPGVVSPSHSESPPRM